ncbi:MAG: acyloxyacyl hydrolase [Alphaproteobacteria bacterium]|nr:acyloxyacyl hydrolase [Alphaproteobacteria bacterium]
MFRKVSFFIVLCALGANAQAGNPFFGEYKNQIMLTIGQGFDSGELIAFKHLNHPAPYYMMNLQYSQPTTFFRLPARQSINAVKTLGFGRSNYGGGCRYYACNWRDYEAEIFMLSQDVALYNTERWYFGTGMGLAVQGRQNERENTKFLIGFRLFAGYKMTENWNLELVMQHFSNGDTGTENNSYDFWGLGVAYNF